MFLMAGEPEYLEETGSGGEHANSSRESNSGPFCWGDSTDAQHNESWAFVFGFKGFGVQKRGSLSLLSLQLADIQIQLYICV